MTQKTIWVVLRSNIAQLPPVMSMLQVLLECTEYKVAFISSVACAQLNENSRYREYITPISATKGLLGKLVQYWTFRNHVLRTLRNESLPLDVVWYGSLDTVLALLGSNIFRHLPYVLQLHELYDAHQRRLRLIAPIARAAKTVVVPEINRAGILQVWLGLKERPFVIPNKPYKHPRTKLMTPTSDITRSLLAEHLTEKPIVLYQGHISGDRNLMPLAEAMREFPNMELWLMGQDHGYVNQIMAVSDNIKYLGYVPTPLHLEITSYASIGVMSYDLVSLNNLYCAPNKIWEYAGFGIPFLSNDALSLLRIASEHGSGISIKLERMQVIASISLLMIDYVKYCNSASSFYNSFCYDQLLVKVDL